MNLSATFMLMTRSCATFFGLTESYFKRVRAEERLKQWILIILKYKRNFNLGNDKDIEETEQCYFVGETTVDLFDTKEKILQITDLKLNGKTLPEKLFKLNISGGIEIEIICTFLKWESLGHIKGD